jgi:hypothetical protein
MLHAEATGAWGLALRDKFAVVLCRNAHERLRDDPLGKHFPWQSTPAAPRIPLVDFDIVAHSRPDVASLGVPLRRPPGKGPTQYRILGIRGRAASAVRLMIKGGGRAPWLARKLARRTFPELARKWVRSLAPSRLPALVLPQHPRHPHPSARLRPQRTYQDRDLPQSPVHVPPQVLHPERFKPWWRQQQPVII